MLYKRLITNSLPRVGFFYLQKELMPVVADFKKDGLWVKSVSNVGRNNRTKTVAGRLWDNMCSRCATEYTGYKGSSMSDSFKDYQFFVEWCHKQVGYGEVGYELDKDLLVEGNKVYSESTCVFIPSSLNLFIVRRKDREDMCVGLERWRKRYKASIRIDNRSTHLGYYDTHEQAHTAYKQAKEAQRHVWIGRLTQGQYCVDSRVVDRLRVVPLYN